MVQRARQYFLKKIFEALVELHFYWLYVCEMKTGKKTKLKFTGFRLPPGYLEKAKARAAMQHRSFGKYVTNLIATDLEQWEREKAEKINLQKTLDLPDRSQEPIE